MLGQEIASLKLNINQLAAITDVHHQTVAARLKNVDPAAGSNSKLKLYLITDILTELLIPEGINRPERYAAVRSPGSLESRKRKAQIRARYRPAYPCGWT
ncbi:DUF1441 family protein [Cedecea neteri]|uniref:DUF1441 family protein n=1 Tax=Cedecea neteri TaxID=158822 RepID=UPI0039E2319B